MNLAFPRSELRAMDETDVPYVHLRSLSVDSRIFLESQPSSALAKQDSLIVSAKDASFVFSVSKLLDILRASPPRTFSKATHTSQASAAAQPKVSVDQQDVVVESVRIPSPIDGAYPVSCTLSGSTLFVAYASIPPPFVVPDDPIQTNIVIYSLSENHQPKEKIVLEDPIPPSFSSVGLTLSYSFANLDAWDPFKSLLFVASSASTEIAALINVSGAWTLAILPEQSQIFMPLIHPSNPLLSSGEFEADQDTFPVDISIYIHSETPLPPLSTDAPPIPPSPILIIVSNAGELIAFDIINASSNNPYPLMKPLKKLIDAKPIASAAKPTIAPVKTVAPPAKTTTPAAKITEIPALGSSSKTSEIVPTKFAQSSLPLFSSKLPAAPAETKTKVEPKETKTSEPPKQAKEIPKEPSKQAKEIPKETTIVVKGPDPTLLLAKFNELYLSVQSDLSNLSDFSKSVSAEFKRTLTANRPDPTSSTTSNDGIPAPQFSLADVSLVRSHVDRIILRVQSTLAPLSETKSAVESLTSQLDALYQKQDMCQQCMDSLISSNPEEPDASADDNALTIPPVDIDYLGPETQTLADVLHHKLDRIYTMVQCASDIVHDHHSRIEHEIYKTIESRGDKDDHHAISDWPSICSSVVGITRLAVEKSKVLEALYREVDRLNVFYHGRGSSGAKSSDSGVKGLVDAAVKANMTACGARDRMQEKLNSPSPRRDWSVDAKQQKMTSSHGATGGVSNRYGVFDDDDDLYDDQDDGPGKVIVDRPSFGDMKKFLVGLDQSEDQQSDKAAQKNHVVDEDIMRNARQKMKTLMASVKSMMLHNMSSSVDASKSSAAKPYRTVTLTKCRYGYGASTRSVSMSHASAQPAPVADQSKQPLKQDDAQKKIDVAPPPAPPLPPAPAATTSKIAASMSLFGVPPPSTKTETTTAASSLFGAMKLTTASPLFGTTKLASTTVTATTSATTATFPSLFGSTTTAPALPSLFSAMKSSTTTAASSPLFGATKPILTTTATSSPLFGATGLSGVTSKPLFGAPSSSTASSSAAASPAFGTVNLPTTTASTTTSSLFGATNPADASKASGSTPSPLFPAIKLPTTTTTTSSSLLFGAMKPSTGGPSVSKPLFGASSTAFSSLYSTPKLATTSIVESEKNPDVKREHDAESDVEKEKDELASHEESQDQEESQEQEESQIQDESQDQEESVQHEESSDQDESPTQDESQVHEDVEEEPVSAAVDEYDEHEDQQEDFSHHDEDEYDEEQEHVHVGDDHEDDGTSNDRESFEIVDRGNDVASTEIVVVPKNVMPQDGGKGVVSGLRVSDLKHDESDDDGMRDDDQDDARIDRLVKEEPEMDDVASTPTAAKTTTIKSGDAGDAAVGLFGSTQFFGAQNKSAADVLGGGKSGGMFGLAATSAPSATNAISTSAFGSSGIVTSTPQQPPKPAVSPFGQPAFGQTAFGQPSAVGGVFGGSGLALPNISNAPVFGQSVFGQTAGSASGSSASSGSSFAALAANASSSNGGSVFGSNAAPSAFGSAKPSAFGSTTQSAFGKPANTSAFGSATPSAFGSTATSMSGSAFGSGSTTPSAFGNPTQVFGSSSTSAFGSSSAPAFGTPSAFGVHAAPSFANISGASVFGSSGSTTAPTSTPVPNTAGTTSFAAFAATNSASNVFGSASQQQTSGKPKPMSSAFTSFRG